MALGLITDNTNYVFKKQYEFCIIFSAIYYQTCVFFLFKQIHKHKITWCVFTRKKNLTLAPGNVFNETR